MSQTPTPGRVNAKDYSYIAAAMAAGLKKAAHEGRISPGLIPINVLKGACEFFEIALDGIYFGIPLNAVATASRYHIAAEALRRSCGQGIEFRVDLNSLLCCYQKMLDQFCRDKTDRILSIGEVSVARCLATFFDQIVQLGEK